MTTAVVIALIASFLWAVASHIDKYLLCQIDSSTSSIKTLMVFSTFVAGLVVAPVWLVINKFQVQINIWALAITLLASLIYVLATYLYYKGLEKNDASIVIVIFQLIPVFSYILGLIFFNETLGLNQIIGGLIIISSAIIISFDFGEKSSKNKTMALVLITLSSFLSSLYYILFEVAMRKSSYNAVMLWYQIGLILIGIVFLLINSYRKEFMDMIKENGKKFISINVVNEGINLVSHSMVNFANLTIPLALANVLNGFQGAFVFFIGAVGMMIVPKVFSEDLSKKVVLQKVSCIILGIIGMAVMFLY